MATLVNIARDLFPSKSKVGTSESRSDSRSIPPEPVQQQTEGSFTTSEREPALQTLNLARANKGCKNLAWSEQLGSAAERHAAELAKSGKLRHSSEAEDVGENLFMTKPGCSEATYEDAVKHWLGEEAKYRGEKVGEGDSGKSEHYTQCMWQKTEHTGMGKARAPDGTTYIVAQYFPRGNVVGEKPF